MLLCYFLFLSVISQGFSFEGDESVRMYGGSEVSIEEVPYQVALLSNDLFVCGGGLLSSRTVLTGGKCFLAAHRYPNQVRAGSAEWKSGMHTRKIRKVFLMDECRSFDCYNQIEYVDLALVTLESPLPQNTIYIKFLKLPSKDENLNPLTSLTCAGWGMTGTDVEYGTDTYTYPDKLRKNTFTTTPKAACDEEIYFYKSDRLPNQIPDTHLCTKGEQGYALCVRDEGNPLVLNNIVYGIFSFKDEECNSFKPSVYTKVSAFVDWIEDKKKRILEVN